MKYGRLPLHGHRFLWPDTDLISLRSITALQTGLNLHQTEAVPRACLTTSEPLGAFAQGRNRLRIGVGRTKDTRALRVGPPIGGIPITVETRVGAGMPMWYGALLGRPARTQCPRHSSTTRKGKEKRGSAGVLRLTSQSRRSKISFAASKTLQSASS